jgi:uncharacterized Zn finger protein (UPF0148 family)
MSSYTWVCFDCRRSVRRTVPKDGAVSCATCGKSCRYLGTKIRLPAREKTAEWSKLRDSLNEAKLEEQTQRERSRVRHRHELEKRILELELEPANASRKRQIQTLRERLKAL